MKPKAKAKQGPDKTCGSCTAGIVVMNDTDIQRCDECSLFTTDEDAMDTVQALLATLHMEYRGRDTSDTVADALERLFTRTLRRSEKRAHA